MKFANWLALKLLRNHTKFLILVIIALTFGITQRISVNLLLRSIQSALVTQSKTFLLGDIEVRSSKPLTPAQFGDIHEVVPKNTQFQYGLECLSIAITSENSKSLLVSVKAVDDQFPLYGKLQLTQFGKEANTQEALKTMQNQPEIWVDQSLKIILNLQEGSHLRLGKLKFLVKGFIASEPGQGIQGFSFGPRVYIGYPMLQESGLLDEGSRVSYITLLKLPSQSNPSNVSQKIKKTFQIVKKNKGWMTPFIPQEGIQVTTHFEKAQQWLRLFGNLGNYFSLLSIVLLILSLAAVGTMVKGYIEKNLPQFGVVEVLGASKKNLMTCIAVLLGYLFSLATVLGVIIGCIGYAAIKIGLTEALPLAKGWTWMVRPILLAILQTGLLTLVFSQIPILFARNWTTQELLNGKGRVSLNWIEKISLAGIATVVIWISMLLETHAIGLSTIMALSLSGLVAMFYMLISILISQIPKWSQKWIFYCQFGINNLYRFRSYMVFAMTSLCIGLCCLSMIMLYKNALISELEIDRNQRFPDLFLVGIYDFQKNDLNQFFYQWSSKLQLEPLIKARLVQLRGVDAKKIATESDQKEFLINREQNLSYRESLSPAETLEKGEWMKGYYQIEASLEQEFAKSLGIKLGDSLVFEVQGVNIEARITSLRRVKWTTFSPNFFILLSKNALRDAPKEWLGTVSGLTGDSLLKVQAQLAEQFPSITIIPVKSSVEKIKRILNLVFHAISILSLLTVLSGILTLVSVLSLTFTLRIPDINMLKILGFQYPAIRFSTLAELLSLTTICYVFANITSTAIIYTYIRTQPQLSFRLTLSSLILQGICLLILTAVLSIVMAKRLYKTKPKFTV